MELRRYWNILLRRWLLILIPALVVLGVGVATYQPIPPAYNVGVRFIVGQTPSPEAETADEQRYYNWLISEYIVNGLADWVRGREFAGMVSQELAAQGMDVPAGAIQITADNARSVLTISMNYGDAATLQAMIETTIQVLMERNAEGLPQLGGETAVLIQLDQPFVNQVPNGLRGQLDLPLRVLFALATGVGLAFLVEYLDPTLRSRQEVIDIGLSVLGEIPQK